MTNKRWLALVALVGWAGWAGCVGEIGDGGEGEEGQGPDDGTEALAEATMHRLNTTEYRNTIRDLLGSSLDPAANFPADDVSHGFDNIAEVLTMSPLHFELYEAAAGELASEALAIPNAASTSHFEAEDLSGSVGTASGSAWNLFSNGEVGTTVNLPGDGNYTIRARVWGQQAGPDLAQASIVVGGITLGTFDVAADVNAPEIISANAALSAGTTTVNVGFLNDYYQDPDDRNLLVDWIEVEGPLGVTGSNPTREQIVFCDPADGGCRRDILREFATRAWRRPATDEEVDRLIGLVDVALGQGDTVNVGLELAVRGVLLSPSFLFRPELDEDPTSTEIHPLSPYELASRLSYFLWSSMPDQQLFDAAAAGDLDDEVGLASEVDRMLADPKAFALVENFAGQWLLVRSLVDHVPDYATYPSYDDVLRDSFREETQLFFNEFLIGNVGLDQLLSAEFTFLNDRLAAHYNLPFSGGSQFEKVSTEGAPERQGLLTQGSLLTVTSYPNRTSPVKRGVWVLEQLLCDGPPPPPAGVEGLIQDPNPTGSLRERLEAHRADPSCATCHSLMDPLGFGLESYDGIGAYRTQDVDGFAIDASGEYPQGGSFNGAAEMSGLIQSDPRYMECLVEKLFTYALGRGVATQDRDTVDAVVEGMPESEYKMPALIKAIVTSEPFRMRRGIKEETP